MSGLTPSPRQLRAFTTARVGIGITGVSQSTSDHLDFQRCHALARDAVYARLNAASLADALQTVAGTTAGGVLRLHSAAGDRAIYLQRPDLGRTLDEASREVLARRSHAHCDVAIVIADGLSALAIERHAIPLIEELLPLLAGWTIAPLCIVEQGRVAIGDTIGAAMGAEISVVLIGERPGLSSPDSLGVYITWNPRPGRTDAERECISNIRADGLSYAQAGAQLHSTLNDARRLRLTGVAMRATSNRFPAGRQP
jgi:ethanolamine ammonia-lyase small subunit